MDITYIAHFCSKGSFMPGGKNADHIFERCSWQNQHGNGYEVELNLIWFQFSLSFYFPMDEDGFDHDEDDFLDFNGRD